MGDFVAWYRREDYPRIREIMEDGHEWPEDYDEWTRAMQRMNARAQACGVTLEAVIVDPDEFLAFCREQKIPCDGEARARFNIAKGLAKGVH